MSLLRAARLFSLCAAAVGLWLVGLRDALSLLYTVTAWDGSDALHELRAGRRSPLPLRSIRLLLLLFFAVDSKSLLACRQVRGQRALHSPRHIEQRGLTTG